MEGAQSVAVDEILIDPRGAVEVPGARNGASASPAASWLALCQFRLGQITVFLAEVRHLQA
jgi:hypothetical protein